MRELCSNCMEVIIENADQTDIMLLNYLHSKKTMDNKLSIPKSKMIEEIKGLTDFKFQKSIKGLRLVDLVKADNNVRPPRFFLTPNGKKLVEFYKKKVQFDRATY